jgi:hypothetical protein
MVGRESLVRRGSRILPGGARRNGCALNDSGQVESGRFDSAAGEVALMLSRGAAWLVDRDAPQYASLTAAFSARREE